MSNILEGRPFAGNWSQDNLNKNRKIITWTPDAIVMLNGDTKIAGCNECKNKIDFQAFITSVSVNAGVSSGDSSSTIDMSIPSHYGDSIFKDGEFLFSTGVEVNIYYRGFFEIEGHVPEGDIYDNNGEQYDLSKVAMRPYYPVFHGVVTSVSFNFSGGFYSASLSCNGMLHFWQNQKINTNAAYLAATPAESRGSMRLDGHVYTNMTPHQIIYDLYRDSGGSAGDAEWVFSSSSNQNNKNPAGRSMFSDTLRYWENRFAQGMYALRMYGASGSMFSSLQTAFIGDPSRGKKKGSDLRKIIRGQHDITGNTKPTSLQLSIAQTLGIFEKDDNSRFLRAADLQYTVELDDSGKGQGLGLLATELKAFITDIGALGNVELFSSSFETKQAIADTVAEKIGYEFYQDVDGDLVFKPPFYNLDTSSSRIYRIKREDVLDISFQHEEPQYTYAICKAGPWRNIAGLGMEGTWGVKGTYVDYRLVAKYGWKPLEFDSTFFNSARQAFFAAVVELEKANTNINGCSLSIPLRPELKPGYPVYIEHIDCFYYVTSISHSFSFGGDCTTGLTLTARRKKYLPPGDPNEEGVDSIRLDDPLFPPKALISKQGDGTHYKRVGFPNVVMALDPYHIDPAQVVYGLDLIAGASSARNSKDREVYRRMLIKTALNLKCLRLAGKKQGQEGNDVTLYKGPWVIDKADGTTGTLKKKKESYPVTSRRKVIGRDGKSVRVKKTVKVYGTKEMVKGELGLRRDVLQYRRGLRVAAKARKKGLKDAQQISEQVEKDYQAAKAKLRGEGGEATIIDLIEAIEHQVKSKTGYASSLDNTAGILANLSNKKASFNPNQPGYYRYYSSSHPDPEHQGPPQFKQRNITSDTKGGKSDITFENVAIDKTTNNMVKDEVASGSHNRVIYTSGDVKRGLLTRTRYTDDKTEVVPTKDILFLSFQEHGYASSYNRLITQVSKRKKIKGSEFLKAISDGIVRHLTRKMGKKTTTADAVKKKAFRLGRVKACPTFGRVKSLIKDGAVFTGTIDKDAVRNSVITDTKNQLLEGLKTDFSVLGTTENMDANNVRKIVADVRSHLGVTPRIKGKLSYRRDKGFEYKDSWKSPIFPVSDEQGYELFGAYQYGRGLDIVQGAEFDSLLKQDTTRILNESDVDAFLKELHATKDKKNRRETFRSLAVRLFERLQGSQTKLEKAFNRLTGKDLPQGFHKKQGFIDGVTVALMSDKNDKAEVVANVPVRLSEIRPETRGDAACDCRGDTSDVEIFLADEGNFLTVQSAVDIDDSEIVTQYKNEIEGKVETWKRRQRQLSGDKE